MGIFRRKKIKKTEFIHDPEAFIQFLRSDDIETVEFGIGSLSASGKDVLEPMLSILIDDKEEEKVRDRAGQVLSRIGEPVIFPLIAILENLEFSSRSSSITIGKIASVLGGIGTPVIEPMIIALKSPFKQVRFGAAIALLQTGESKAVHAVKKAAEEGDAENSAMFNMVLGEK